MKYVIREYMGIEIPVIFPDLVNHDDVTERIFGRVVAAGFCRISASRTEEWDTCICSNVVDVACWGESQTLGVKSRGDVDATIIQKEIKVDLK